MLLEFTIEQTVSNKDAEFCCICAKRHFEGEVFHVLSERESDSSHGICLRLVICKECMIKANEYVI